MICTTCLYSVFQTFANGEMTSGILFCKVLMRDMKGNLVKCGGYDAKEVEEEIKILPDVQTTQDGVGVQMETEGSDVAQGVREKPFTQSERMKEYWRTRKSKKG
jgi:hypothetical protein